jgi:transketolase
MMGGVFPDNWDASLPLFSPSERSIATREASGKAMNAIAAALPTLLAKTARH